MAITTQTSQQTTNATTSTITMPASVASGDMLFALAAEDSGATSNTWDNSFTELLDTGTTGIVCAAAYKIAAGGETSVVATHTTERSNHIALRIPAAEWANDGTAPEISTLATGNNTTPDPGSISPSWGTTRSTIFIVAMFADDSAPPGPITAYPTNYSNNNVSNTTASSAGVIACATRTATVASENPGAFTMTGTETWGAIVIAVKGPAAGGSAVDRTATDSATFSDAAVRVFAGARTVADSVTQALAAARAVTLARSAADAVTQSDAATQLQTILRTAADSLGLSDSPSRVLTLFRTGTDTLTSSVSASRTVVLLRTTADAVSQSVAAVAIKSILRSAADAVTYTDAATRVLALVRTAADASGFSVAASAIKSGATVLGDAVLAFIDRMVAALSFSARQAASLSASARQVATLTTSALEYDLSDTTRPTATFTVDDVATDPTTVTLTVRSPDGTSTDYTYGAAQITKDSTGVYYKDISLTQRGVWSFRFVGTGACAAAVEGTVTVRL